MKPEGVEQSFSETMFLEMEPAKPNSSRSVSFAFPPDVVPGSQRAHVALVGTSTILSSLLCQWQFHPSDLHVYFWSIRHV